ncbi:MAG: hypothetical protein ACFB9M_04965 [Myxococcota bacterium]
MTPPAALLVHLHAHLPDVRGPVALSFEDWYFEALQGCYLRLLDVLTGWARDEVPAAVGLSVSPPLVAMLSDTALNARAEDRWRRCLQLLSREPLPQRDWLASSFEQALALRQAFPEPIKTLRSLEDAGVVELATTGASHGFLPFLRSVHPALVEAQVEIAVRRHTAVFGRSPAGFWVPECAWTKDLDEILADRHIAYSFCEADGADGAVFGAAQPLMTEAGPVVFPRDPGCARDVWDPHDGFPAHPSQREFHRDAGMEIEHESLVSAGLPADGRPLNLKVWAVTGSDVKEPYQPDVAQQTVANQVQAFVQARVDSGQDFHRQTGRPAVFTAPFDAELFGHWWYEGPSFLDKLARHSRPGLALLKPSEVIRSQLSFETRGPRLGSWGEGGFSRTWLGFDNAWVQDEVAASGRTVMRMAETDHPNAPLAAEHHLLACASDWPFILRAGSHVESVTSRVRFHSRAVRRLEAGETVEGRGTFGAIDVGVFRGRT